MDKQPETTLTTLDKALKAWADTMIPATKVWEAMGGVLGGRFPTNDEILRNLRDMDRQLENPAAWVAPGFFIPLNEMTQLLELFPSEAYAMRHYETWVRMTLEKVRERVANYRSQPHWDGKADSKGSILPPLGYLVSIHLGRQDAWVNHTVVGHAVCLVDGQLHAFVNVVDDKGYPNQRGWAEVRPPVE